MRRVKCHRPPRCSWLRKSQWSELYDLNADPHEINNLVANKKHEAKLKELREVHTQWVRDTGDLGLLPEAEIEIREKCCRRAI